MNILGGATIIASTDRNTNMYVNDPTQYTHRSDQENTVIGPIYRAFYTHAHVIWIYESHASQFAYTMYKIVRGPLV